MSESNSMDKNLRALHIHRMPSSCFSLIRPPPVARLDPFLANGMDIAILLVHGTKTDDFNGLSKPHMLLPQINVRTKADIHAGNNFLIHKDLDPIIYDTCVSWVREGGGNLHIVEYTHVRFEHAILAVCLPFRLTLDSTTGIEGVRLVADVDGVWGDRQAPREVITIEDDVAETGGETKGEDAKTA